MIAGRIPMHETSQSPHAFQPCSIDMGGSHRPVTPSIVCLLVLVINLHVPMHVYSTCKIR